MATITVRIPDQVRDALQAQAERERQTLSDFVRDRLEDAVYPFREREDEGDEFSPASMSVADRHTLALLHRILARVLPEDARGTDGDLNYQLERAEVLEQGYTSEYWTEFAALRPELSARECTFVMDVLTMFGETQHGLQVLLDQGVVVDESLRHALTFGGFDHNDRVESQMSDYVRFLVQNGKWTEQEAFVLGPDRGNSHLQMASTYSRMLTGYREAKQQVVPKSMRAGYALTEDQLRHIAAARTHPSHR